MGLELLFKLFYHLIPLFDSDLQRVDLSHQVVGEELKVLICGFDRVYFGGAII